MEGHRGKRASPPLIPTGGKEEVKSAAGKAELLAATSFPPGKPDEHTPTPTNRLDDDDMPSWTTSDMGRFLGTRGLHSAPGPDGLTYRELRLWFSLDPEGLTALVNKLVRDGLPTPTKTAKVVYIPKPGKTDWASPKS